MSDNKLIKKADQILPISIFGKAKFSKDDCISFTGSPMSHPYDKDKFILVADPLSDHTHFLEFHKSDVAFAEELSSISTKAETVPMTRVWINQGVIGVRYEPFIVGKTKNAVETIMKR
jgi:hypothetical protein